MNFIDFRMLSQTSIPWHQSHLLTLRSERHKRKSIHHLRHVSAKLEGEVNTQRKLDAIGEHDENKEAVSEDIGERLGQYTAEPRGGCW